MEHRGFEPLTPTLPVLCAPNCANAPGMYCRHSGIAKIAMRIAGLEPVCLAAPEPKSGVSASSTISAGLPCPARSPGFLTAGVFYTIVFQKSSTAENFFIPLPFAPCHFQFAICPLPFSICHLPFVIMESASPPAPAAASRGPPSRQVCTWCRSCSRHCRNW